MDYYGNNDYRNYLVHYGRKGMRKGKHLPGTTWWKDITRVSPHSESSSIGKPYDNIRDNEYEHPDYYYPWSGNFVAKRITGTVPYLNALDAQDSADMWKWQKEVEQRNLANVGDRVNGRAPSVKTQRDIRRRALRNADYERGYRALQKQYMNEYFNKSVAGVVNLRVDAAKAVVNRLFKNRRRNNNQSISTVHKSRKRPASRRVNYSGVVSNVYSDVERRGSSGVNHKVSER